MFFIASTVWLFSVKNIYFQPVQKPEKPSEDSINKFKIVTIYARNSNTRGSKLKLDLICSNRSPANVNFINFHHSIPAELKIMLKRNTWETNVIYKIFSYFINETERFGMKVLVNVIGAELLESSREILTLWWSKLNYQIFSNKEYGFQHMEILFRSCHM